MQARGSDFVIVGVGVVAVWRLEEAGLAEEGHAHARRIPGGSSRVDWGGAAGASGVTILALGGVFSGTTTNVLTISNVQTNDNGGYSLIITNIAGAVTSSVAVLTVAPSTATRDTSVGTACDLRK